MDSKIYEHFKKRIQQYLDEVREKEKKNQFLIWTESDVQSYLYHRLVTDPQIEKSYSINNQPLLSSIDPEKKYRGNMKPSYQPDLLITPLENLKIEQRKDKPRAEKRLQLLRKDDSIVVEIKFAQDTNDSTGRKSVSKLEGLSKDYRKRKKEGHKWILLVLVEKGNESYLSKEDIKRVPRYKDALAILRPKKSLFD